MSIRKSIVVRCLPETAFRVFTRDIGRWWPLAQGFSFGGERAHEIFLDDREGGRFYERFQDGTEFEIGRVTHCEPPHRIVFSWNSPDWAATTEVEVRFDAEANGTRVELEHRGMEALPQAAEKEERFSGGWEMILRQYAMYADADDR